MPQIFQGRPGFPADRGAVRADPTRYPVGNRVRGAAVFYRLRYPPKVSKEEWLAEKSESR
jgi:hypothetical protein